MAVQLVMYDEEHQKVLEVCGRLCQEANASVVFVIDKNGQLIASAGETNRLDSTSLASLVAGEIAATGGLAQLMGEKEFSTLFHEGVKDHIHISIVASRVILVVIFDSRSSLGLVRLRVRKRSEELGRIFEELSRRSSHRPSPLAEITDEDIDNLFSV
ncbi:MAG: roadblock/LC7 domain-containing protein [Myxococcota bacterium]